jgi:CBS domain-containing protein
MPHIQDFMTSNTVSVEASQPISEAARLMKQHDIGLLPVTSGGSLVGVVTDRDIVIRAVAEDAASRSVGEIVTPNPVIVSPADDAKTAVRLMSQHDVRRLPVAEQGTIVGVVSVGDLATRAGSELAGTVMKNTGPLDRPVPRGAADESHEDTSQQHSLFESAEHGATEVEHLV